MLDMNRGVHLDIQIDNPRPTYKPGDTINGAVYATVDAAINCKQLTVKNRYKLHGKGNSETSDISTLILHEGEWQAGRYKYQFSFTIPNQENIKIPATYHGHYIDLTWQIAAKASLRLGLGPKAQYDFQMDNPPTRILEVDEDINEFSLKLMSLFWLLLFLTPFFMASVFMITQEQISFKIFGSIFGIIPSVIVIITIKSIIEKLVERKFGQMLLLVNETKVSNKINAKLSITTNRNIEVNSLTAYLVFEESATSGSGTDATTYTDEKVVSTFVLSRSHMIILPKNETKSFDISLDVPQALPASIYLPSNQIISKIKIVAQSGNNEYEWQHDLEVV